MQDLPFETLTQFVALGLTLVAGWFLGLASASGGRKWRERYQDVEMEHAGYRDSAEADLRDSARRIRELQAENASLRAGAPAPAPEPAHVDEPVHERRGHSTAALAGAAVAGAAAGAVATHAAHEHHDDHAHAEPVAAAHAEPAVTHDSREDAHPAPADAHRH